ncbi:SAP7 [Candida theae]|uniref:candidapepsin n=1 Tax=Candida theae TaxID=1198502 RepID=A0AAD5BJ58_9ASCO|nr:SAP7 [Candida theae]KAI5967386.1 SAP7 [Candida theae]
MLQFLHLVLLASAALALIGDGFLSLSVNKIQNTNGLGNFPNRLPIFEQLEDDLENITSTIFGKDAVKGKIAPLFGNSAFKFNKNRNKDKGQNGEILTDILGIGKSATPNATSSDENHSGAFSVDLNNAQTMYIASIDIGSPAQEVQVMIDTGSADLWVIGSQNPSCIENGGQVNCSEYGTFNSAKSLSWHKNDSVEFSISYLDGSGATGDFGQDSIQFAKDFVLKEANFAVVDNTSTEIGVFGVGYPSLESASQKYSNIPHALKEQDVIAKAAYSLYLDSSSSSQGSILFGGIDHAKYTGELKTIDIVPKDGQFLYSQIPLSHIAVSLNNYTNASPSGTGSNGAQPGIVGAASIYNGTDSFNGGVDLNDTTVLLDSGTTYSFLPKNQIESILGLFGNVTFDGSLGGYKIPCWLGNKGNYLRFNFNEEKDIDVELSEFVLEVGKEASGEGSCVSTLLPGQAILGDNFLRSAYAVFNLDDNTISLAQAAYNDDHKVVPIE